MEDMFSQVWMFLRHLTRVSICMYAVLEDGESKDEYEYIVHN